MPIVICIEGSDGSGKSTVCRLIQEECLDRGLTCQVVGRVGESASSYVRDLTNLTKELAQDRNAFVVEADFHLRLARECLRAAECRKSPADIVVLDRFVLSVLSRIRIDGVQSELYLPHLREITSRADLVATVFCMCPFELAWSRVRNDVGIGVRATLSPKEARGEEYLRRLSEAMSHDFTQLDWIGERVPIATDSTSEETASQIRTLLFEKLLLKS